MKPTLVVFDLDGTLFDTESAFIPAMEDFFNEFNKPVPSRDELMSLVGEPSAHTKRWLASKQLGEDYETLREKMIAYECTAILKMGKLFDGAGELLQWLNKNSVTVAMCTNAHNSYLDAVLVRCNIREQFKFIYNPQKPGDSKDAMTAEIIRRSGIKNGFFAGDRYHDIEAGKANGLTTIGCRYGYGKEEMLKADLIIDRPLQLIDYIQGQ